MINIKHKTEPVEVSHPGLLLKQVIQENQLTVQKTADLMDVSVDELTAIVNQKQNIRPELAYRLAKFFGTKETLWYTLACQYEWQCVLSNVSQQNIVQLEFPVYRRKRVK